jgi:UDP-N-acetylmuramoyl-tripeptide--D-alanyl-D-alanine ligase
VEAIAHAKGEIYAGLRPGGVAIVNEDDEFAAYWKKLNSPSPSSPSPLGEGRGEGSPSHRIITFGLSERADVHATIDARQVRFVTPADAFAVTLQVKGEHNVRNALAACAAAHALEIPPHAMQEGLAHFAGVPGRQQLRPGLSGSWVIDDSYNANPESMRAAIRVLAAEPGRRVFVMGDMGELGEQSEAMHVEVGAFARTQGIDAFLALGPASRKAASAFGRSARHFDDVDALIAQAKAEAARGATILVKGSRFMQMERVADALAAPGDGHAV